MRVKTMATAADVHDDNERLGKEAKDAHHETKHVLAPGLRKGVAKQTKAAGGKKTWWRLFE